MPTKDAIKAKARRERIKRGEPPRKTGRPAHEPTAATRLDVLASLVCNRTQAWCAERLGISVDRFAVHYAEQIETAKLGQEGVLAQAVVKRALDPAARDALDAGKFVLARRHGWVETSRRELTGAGGGPIAHTFDLTRLDEQELDALEAIHRKLGTDLGPDAEYRVLDDGRAQPATPPQLGSDTGGAEPAFV